VISEVRKISSHRIKVPVVNIQALAVRNLNDGNCELLVDLGSIVFNAFADGIWKSSAIACS